MDDDDQLDELVARARSGDPDTSHDAAEEVDPAIISGQILDWLRRVCPSTSTELARDTHNLYCSVSPRMKPLENKGLIYRTGLKRKSLFSNSMTIVWAATPKKDPP